MVSCGYINIKVTHFQSRRHYCCDTVVLRIFPHCQNTDVDLAFCLLENDVGVGRVDSAAFIFAEFWFISLTLFS